METGLASVPDVQTINRSVLLCVWSRLAIDFALSIEARC